MTPKQIQDMADRELDIHLLTRVGRWKKELLEIYAEYRNGDSATIKLWDGFEDDNWYWQPGMVPMPTTNWATTFEIVKAMQKRWDERFPDETMFWQFTDIRPNGWTARVMHDHHDGPIPCEGASAPTLSRAICEAALLQFLAEESELERPSITQPQASHTPTE